MSDPIRIALFTTAFEKQTQTQIFVASTHRHKGANTHNTISDWHGQSQVPEEYDPRPVAQWQKKEKKLG